MKCLHCSSENVIGDSPLEGSERPIGFLWWLLVGWWLQPILWLFTEILGLMGHRSDGLDGQDTPSPVFICQNCGYRWPAKK